MTKLRGSLGSVALEFSGDRGLLEAAGKISLAHGQLELMLRMTIKTLTGLSVQDALDATVNSKTWELRKDIVKLFRQKTNDVTLQYKLKSLLGRCEQLSEQRNKLLHNAWAIAPDGSVVTKGEKHAWGIAPSADELNSLASEIKKCVELLNEARLNGFIRDAYNASTNSPNSSGQHS
jgi:hypothetical protein